MADIKFLNQLRAAQMSGGAYVAGSIVGGANTWIEFLKANGGRGYGKEQLRAMYHQQMSGGLLAGDFVGGTDVGGYYPASEMMGGKAGRTHVLYNAPKGQSRVIAYIPTDQNRVAAAQNRYNENGNYWLNYLADYRRLYGGDPKYNVINPQTGKRTQQSVRQLVHDASIMYHQQYPEVAPAKPRQHHRLMTSEYPSAVVTGLEVVPKKKKYAKRSAVQPRKKKSPVREFVEIAPEVSPINPRLRGQGARAKYLLR